MHLRGEARQPEGAVHALSPRPQELVEVTPSDLAVVPPVAGRSSSCLRSDRPRVTCLQRQDRHALSPDSATIAVAFLMLAALVVQILWMHAFTRDRYH